MRVLDEYSVRAAVFQKVGLKIMKAAAPVGVGRGVVLEMGFLVWIGFAKGLLSAGRRGASGQAGTCAATYPKSWVG